MIELEKQELAARVRAFNEEEKKVVIDNLPVIDLIEGIKRAYESLDHKYETIQNLFKNSL